MSAPLPIFSTGAALGQGGVFTAEKAGAAAKAGRKHGARSLCDLVKAAGLKQVHVADDRCANLFALHKALKEIGCALHFGLKLIVCDDIADKSEASLKNESKVIVWMAGDGSADYQALINLYSIAATEGFYYQPRIDWKTICAHWQKDLLISLPFYSSFIARNLLSFAAIVPQLPAPPLALIEVGQRLPDDALLTDRVLDYVAGTEGAEAELVKSVYYQDREAAKAFLVWQCILNRGATWDKPGQDGMCSREFCWSAHQELAGIPIPYDICGVRS